MAGSFEGYPGDFPDPDVIRSAGRYYAYGTNRGSANVQLLVSDDLHTWSHLGDALPVLPRWAERGSTWAPSVLDRGSGRFVLYYTVRHRASGRQAISVATATEPSGPFIDISDHPLVFQAGRGGSIDPYVFVDTDGRGYLFWKSDDNALHRRTSLWAQPLSPDGLTLLADPVRLLQQDRRWEDPLIEAPAVLSADGTYYLFYSASWWESASYGIGYAVSADPLGRFEKVTTAGPWLASSGDAAGPGGQAFVTDDDGTAWMAYHAWHPDRVGYRQGGARSLRLVALDVIDGRPQPV